MFESPMGDVQAWAKKMDRHLHKLDEIGKQYIVAQSRYFRIEKSEKAFLAQLASAVQKSAEERMAEAAAQRAALASDEYLQYLKKMFKARQDYLTLKQQYDLLRDQMEIMRSILSMEKEAMRLV